MSPPSTHQSRESIQVRLIFIALIAAFGSVCTAAPQRGQNLLGNPGFEQVEGATASQWRPMGSGYTVVAEEQHGADAAIMCESEEPQAYYGAMQQVTFDPPINHPFKVAGYSRAENAAGADYCLYMDCWYEDGTNLWGQRGEFRAGTHGWQRVEYTFDVTKPVTKIQYFILFRRCTGRAWFDDVSLSLVPFQVYSQRVIPSLYGGNSIDYIARLSLPADWQASVVKGEKQLYSQSGHGSAVALLWDGTNEEGRLLRGGEYTVRVSAQDDIEGESLQHETHVQTNSGSGRGYVAWTESSVRRVLYDAVPADGRMGSLESEIALAGNEYESFQIALRAAPGHDLQDCTVAVTDLRDDAGHLISAENIQWHQVGFVYLHKLHEHPFMEHAGPGWWPDPLLPVENFNLEGGTTQALWFTLYAPAGTHPSVYTGKITVSPGNARDFVVNVRARVFGFDVPTQPHIKTAFALMDGYLEKIYGELSPQLRQAYGDFLLKHRLNPDDISRTEPPAIEDLEHYYDRGLNAYNALNVVEQRGNRTWVCWSPLEVYTPQFKRSLIERLDPYVAELRRRGLIDKAYIYTFDERGEDFWPTIKEYFGMVQDRYGIPTLTTARIPLDAGKLKELNVDWICPVSSRYDYEKAEQCRQAGVEVWSYVCLGPRYPYANWLADDPLIEARILWWQAFHQKMDGFLYWGLNIWSRAHNDHIIDPKDGPRLQWSISTHQPGGRWDRLHGDGVMLYPGPEGPIGSIRLAAIRDGIEDYEYLWLLGRLLGDGEAATKACGPVTGGLTQFTRNPNTLYAQRTEIAERIEQLIQEKEKP